MVHQPDQMWRHMYQAPYTMAFVSMFFLLVAIGLMLFFFPRLEGLRSTENLRPKVETLRETPRAEGPIPQGSAEQGKAIEIALRLMEPDEKRVVEALVAAGGSMLQKDISRELGTSRVKTHRVLVRLIRRGVVTAEKHFNTNRIEIADWLAQ
jgi:hypothetical protein